MSVVAQVSRLHLLKVLILTCNIVTEGMVLSIHNVHCLLEKELGGAEGKVAYIGMFPSRVRVGHHSELADRVNTSDTEGTFRPERYHRLSKQWRSTH